MSLTQTHRNKIEKRNNTNTGFYNYTGVYQLSRANCEEYQRGLKYTDTNPRRKLWQN